MKIAVTSTGRSLDSAVDPRFGRCACFAVVETGDMSFEAVDNASASLGGGAGIQSARVVAENGVEIVLTGNVGPSAHQALSAAGIRVVTGCSGTAAEAIERFRAGGMEPADGPTVGSHSGLITAVDRERCTGCGACVDVCPRRAIVVGRIAKVETALCDGCGDCVGECPALALSLVARAAPRG